MKEQFQLQTLQLLSSEDRLNVQITNNQVLQKMRIVAWRKISILMQKFKSRWRHAGFLHICIEDLNRTNKDETGQDKYNDNDSYTKTDLKTMFFMVAAIFFSPSRGRFSTCHSMISSSSFFVNAQPWCSRGVQLWTRRHRPGHGRRSRHQGRGRPSRESDPGPAIAFGK